jgi:hypothetical protein
MRPIIAIVVLLFMSAGTAVLRAQPMAAAGKQTVLILLRQPEGALAKRLAEAPSSTPVPEEVRAAALREQASMVVAQRNSFDRRMTAAGATGVIHYPELNMARAEISQSALSSLQSDPAVVSVTPLSEDTQAVAGGRATALPAANLVDVGAQPAAGVAAGRLGRRSETVQPPSLQPGMAFGQMSAVPPGLPPGLPMTPPNAPNPAFMPGMQTPGFPASGGMFQSILGLTGQMGMQAGAAMPRAAGMLTLLSGGAQIAQAIVTARKQGCGITLATVEAQIPEDGGQGVIAVNAPPNCLWRARSDADWLQINAEGPVIGPGIVKYTAAAAGAGMLRTGVIDIVGVANVKVKGKTSITVRQGN